MAPDRKSGDNMDAVILSAGSDKHLISSVYQNPYLSVHTLGKL